MQIRTCYRFEDEDDEGEVEVDDEVKHLFEAKAQAGAAYLEVKARKRTRRDGAGRTNGRWAAPLDSVDPSAATQGPRGA